MQRGVKRFYTGESLNKKLNPISFNIRKRFSNLRKDFRLLKLKFKFRNFTIHTNPLTKLKLPYKFSPINPNRSIIQIYSTLLFKTNSLNPFLFFKFRSNPKLKKIMNQERNPILFNFFWSSKDRTGARVRNWVGFGLGRDMARLNSGNFGF